MLRKALRAYNFWKRKKKDSWTVGCGANAVKVFEKNTTCKQCYFEIKLLVRWRFFSKPVGLDLDSVYEVDGGNNLILQTFLLF
ncbi:hypothetical protein EC396_09140 [Lutibacter sp. HS1-25]|nr:hypothetical protein EC396_09140 [Lutibacter sp. HS1-25]